MLFSASWPRQFPFFLCQQFCRTAPFSPRPGRDRLDHGRAELQSARAPEHVPGIRRKRRAEVTRQAKPLVEDADAKATWEA